jgi:hypothetical protein
MFTEILYKLATYVIGKTGPLLSYACEHKIPNYASGCRE